MKTYLFLSAFFLCSHLALGQNTHFAVKEIDSIVARIDSSCIRGGVTDYFFHNKRNNKKASGGGADWFYTDRSGTQLLKVVRESLITSENLEIYYFFQDSLIYLNTSNGTYIAGKKQISWHTEYYFQNSRVTYKRGDWKYAFDPKTYFETARKFFSSEQIWRRSN